MCFTDVSQFYVDVFRSVESDCEIHPHCLFRSDILDSTQLDVNLRGFNIYIIIELSQLCHYVI